MPHKYSQQLRDCGHTGPWKTPASALHTPTLATPLTVPATSKAPPSQKDDATTSTSAEGKRQSAAQASDQPAKQKTTAEPTSPMATSPTHQKRPALPAPPPTAQTSNSAPQQRANHWSDLETAEQPKGKMRINAIKFTQGMVNKWRQHPMRTQKKSTMKGSY